MNHYFTSEGERLTQSQLDYRIREAKAKVLKNQFEEHGYNFCEQCGINANGAGKLDCSHDISVKKAKEMRKAELSYDTRIIVIRCRKCHEAHDKLNLQYSSNEA